jgi:hypothetical protein
MAQAPQLQTIPQDSQYPGGTLMQPPLGIAPQLVTPNAPPERYFDGQLPSLGYELLRAVNVTGYQLLEEQQVQQWTYVLETDIYAGVPQADVQNVRIPVATQLLVPPTLDPSYGLVAATVPDVLRNIGSIPQLFEN